MLAVEVARGLIWDRLSTQMVFGVVDPEQMFHPGSCTPWPSRVLRECVHPQRSGPQVESGVGICCRLWADSRGPRISYQRGLNG